MSQIGRARFAPRFGRPNRTDVGHKNYPSESKEFEGSRSFDRFGQTEYWPGSGVVRLIKLDIFPQKPDGKILNSSILGILRTPERKPGKGLHGR
jgi:hypothetical protein